MFFFSIFRTFAPGWMLYTYTTVTQTAVQTDLIEEIKIILWYGNEPDGTCIVLFIPQHKNGCSSLLRFFRDSAVTPER